jgi:CTP:molybdopterin cytidylyltransferase MocA
LLNSSSIKKLIDYYDSQKKYKKSVYPVNSYKRGNPIIISNDFLKIALIEKVFNLKDFLKKHPTHVTEFSTEEEGFFLDIDTELDVQHLRDQHKTDLELPIK